MADHLIVLYNAQRFFRPGGSGIARSLDFTARLGWTSQTYRLKVDAVGAVLADATKGARPGLLVLCEVEDHQVVTDILTAAGWPEMVDIVVPNEQIDGYDVAMAYDPNLFQGGVTACETFQFDNRFSTRDLLSATLSVGDGQQLIVFATHWASRSLTEGVFLRIAAAAFCTRAIETQLKFDKSILIAGDGGVNMPARQELRSRWWTPLLIAGDFNDDPWDSSLRGLLRSTMDIDKVLREPRLPSGRGLASVANYLSLRPRLYNPNWQLFQGTGARGTYMFDDEWRILDQILVSAGMLRTSGPRFVHGSLGIYAPLKITSPTGRTITVTTKSGEPVPFNVKTGEGVSDHLPIVATLRFD